MASNFYRKLEPNVLFIEIPIDNKVLRQWVTKERQNKNTTGRFEIMLTLIIFIEWISNILDSRVLDQS